MINSEAHHLLHGAPYTEGFLKFHETHAMEVNIYHTSTHKALQVPVWNHYHLISFPSLIMNMAERIGLLFLVVLGAAWACDARELANPGTSELSRKPDVYALCEEYTAKTLDYLNKNKTQNEIIATLHNTCSQLLSFKQKCIALVDNYAPLFFLEIASIQPGDFCNKVNLAQHIATISLQVQQHSCRFCNDTVSALLAKLKDPDTELEIIETLLKVCDVVDKYADKCKRMVFDYAPLVFYNAEKFLENTDICTALHASARGWFSSMRPWFLVMLPARLQQELTRKPFLLTLNYGNKVLQIYGALVAEDCSKYTLREKEITVWFQETFSIFHFLFSFLKNSFHFLFSFS